MFKIFEIFKKKPPEVSAAATGGTKPQEGDHQVYRNGKWVYEQVEHVPHVPSELLTITVKVGAGVTGFSKASDSQAPCKVTGGARNLSVAHGRSTMPFLVTVYRYSGDRLAPVTAPYSCESGVIHFDDYINLVGIDPSVIILMFRELA